MTAAERLRPLDWEVYLEGEELAKRKHEYVCGRVYAMAGGTYEHNRIGANILGTLHGALRGSPCHVLGSDHKVRVRCDAGDCFFYPDVLVDCEPKRRKVVYTDTPKIVVEVLSASTRRIDEGEKREQYLKIPSLAAYLLVDSQAPGAVVWRRTGAEFRAEVYRDPAAVVPLPEIGAELPLAEAYAGIVWSDRTEDEEEEM